MIKFLLLIWTLSSSIFSLGLPVSSVDSQVNIQKIEAPENSILYYYYKIPSDYFIKVNGENEKEVLLIAKTAEERKAALDKLVDIERLGKNENLFSGPRKDYKLDDPDNMLATVDEENYYLYMNPNESFGDFSQAFTMTVFIKSNGEHVIAAESHNCGLWCYPGYTKMILLTYKNGVWTDATDQLLPQKKIENFVKNEVMECEKLNAENGDEKEIHERCVERNAGLAYNLPQKGTTIKTYNGVSEWLFRLEWKNDKFEFAVNEIDVY